MNTPYKYFYPLLPCVLDILFNNCIFIAQMKQAEKSDFVNSHQFGQCLILINHFTIADKANFCAIGNALYRF